jgi:probable phosphoglycerate mutase
MIYFVRHGLSEANVKRVFAGQKDDSPLVEEGKEQARITGKKRKEKGIKIYKIISSPSRRARETAQIIARELSFDPSDILIDDRIIEYDMGTLSGTPWGVISSKVLVGAKDAENPQDFHERVYSCIRELSRLPENVLLVSHGGVGRMLETIRKDGNPELFYDIPVYPNAEVVEVDWI